MWEGGNVCTGSRRLGIQCAKGKKKKGLHRFPGMGTMRKWGNICTGPGQQAKESDFLG